MDHAGLATRAIEQRPHQAAHLSGVLALQSLTGCLLQVRATHFPEHCFDLLNPIRSNAQAADTESGEDSRCSRIRGRIATNRDVPVSCPCAVHDTFHQA